MSEQIEPTNTLLDNINTPKDLRDLSIEDLEQLASEIRQEIIGVVSKNGGHLAPSLGAVELTLALHYVFNTPEDKLVWDVGHQAYVHKIITGRKKLFKTLRQDEGCLGFLTRDESEYDVFGAGHAGTAISAALGIATARDQRHEDYRVVAVVGDGSLNCGISLEGLNNVSEATKDFIILLNDNKMSISPNVGALPKYLNRIISGRGYNRFKALAKMMLKKIPHGEDIRRKISRIEEATKSLFVPGVFFEELGIRYIGPIDGHNLDNLIHTLQGIKEFNRPVILHTITEKGRGYHPAENAPEKFHGLGSFNPTTGKVKKDGAISFSSAFGKSICELAEQHDDVVAITAAMCSGTCLTEFSERFPKRFYDVGIAEEHALVFAAGIATGEMRPIVAIYSTFLQRALDCVFHDICLQNLPVIICCDRAGIVDDGPTHHGIHDVPFLRNLPNLSILSPKNGIELRQMLFNAYDRKGPVIIRYPKGCSGKQFNGKNKPDPIEWGKAEIIQKGEKLSIWAVGKEVTTALEISDILERKHNIHPTIVNTRFIKPLDTELLVNQSENTPIVTIENCQYQGGLGSIVDEILINRKNSHVLHFGWDTEIIPHGTIQGIRERAELTPEKIAEKIHHFMENLGQ